MEIDILLWVVWVLGVVTVAIGLLPMYKERHKAYSAMNNTFFKLMVALAFLQTSNFIAKYVLMNVMGFHEPILPKNLRIDMITSFGVLAVLLHFSLYAVGRRRHYSLPWVWFIFQMAYLIEVGEVMFDVSIITSAAVAVGIIILFINKAIKNRAGLMLGIGFYVVINLVAALLIQYAAKTVVEEEFYMLLGFTLGYFMMGLATWNIFERYILYDRQKEKAIKSTWISKIMQTGVSTSESVALAPSKGKDQARQIPRRVTCPMCKTSKIWELPSDVITTRERSQKGIILIHVPAGTTCDHTYDFYLGKSFEILGYNA